jgi:L-fuculose-phosphate aldolase
LTHPRDAIVHTMERIYRYRMTTTSGGNVSIQEESGDIWISPARVDKGNLTRSDIVCVRPDGSVEGSHRPSSEFPFHEAIYTARPDIRAIVHAHPVALVAFSICSMVPDTRIFHQAHHVCGQPGFAPYALPGSRQLGENIAATFAGGFDCVILENHGVVVGGPSLSEAFQRFEALEFAGRTIVEAGRLGTPQYLSEQQLEAARSREASFEPLQPSEPTAEEKELRRQLFEFIRRGCRQRLLISTEGSYSARLDEHSFLITPSQRDREGLEIDDFVLVRDGCAEADKTPSRATRAHQAIYRRHPEVRSIVFAHPIHATAFSVTGAAFDARTIPESFLFLRDVARVPYGVQYRPDDEIADYVSPNSPAAILDHDGVVVAGTSVFDAFDRLEVLESTAEAIVLSATLGEVSPMPETVIDELNRAFPG